jgi:hypothetical protein
MKMEWNKPVVREIIAPLDVILALQAEIEASHDALTKGWMTVVPARAMPGRPECKLFVLPRLPASFMGKTVVKKAKIKVEEIYLEYDKNRTDAEIAAVRRDYAEQCAAEAAEEKIRFDRRFDTDSDWTPPRSKFRVELSKNIAFDLNEEFLIDGLMPKEGVGLLYGASQTFKSFVAMHMATNIARGAPWAGRKTEGGLVFYVGAEGASGLRKRYLGLVKAGPIPASGIPFAFIPASPNLGAASGDCVELIDTIKTIGKPCLVIIDTIAKVTAGADENGIGMSIFLKNVETLAKRFGCFVLAIHHTGWDASGRPRGWSGSTPGVDVQMLSERVDSRSSVITMQKLKDEESNDRYDVKLRRVVLGVSDTGQEVSTLVVDSVAVADAKTKAGNVGNAPDDVMKVLKALVDNPGASIAALAKASGVHTSSVNRRLKHMATDKGGKLVAQTGGKWTPTKAGIDRFAP